MDKYDSRKDTIDHILQVGVYLDLFSEDLRIRKTLHDLSKLGDIEKPVFDMMTPKLRNLTYGSEEYKQSLKLLDEALLHHYENNSHHPEHYKNGIDGMNLIDVLEMLCDWKAATLRHTDGNILKSLEINRKRFNISDQLYQILLNTCQEMGWLDEEN